MIRIPNTLLAIVYYFYTIEAKLLPVPLSKYFSIDLLTQICYQFRTYDFVYHFDNITASQMDFLLLRPNEQFRSNYLMNHDMIDVYSRPATYKYLHIVLLDDPANIFAYTEDENSFYIKDVVLFVLPNGFKQEFWHLEGLKMAASVLLLETEQQILSHICFYCGIMSAKLKQITLDPESGNLPDLFPFNNNYKNLKGHIFNVGYSEFKPFFWCTKSTEKRTCQPEGVEGAMLQDFAAVYNFSYTLIPFWKNRTSDKGVAQHLVEAVSNREIDWAIGGISASLARGEFTYFTRYIRTQGFYVLFFTKTPPLSLEWVDILMLLALGIAVAMGLVVKLASGVETGTNFLDFIQICMMAMVEQGIKLYRTDLITVTVKIMLLTWWIMALSITTTYKSQLASDLVRPAAHEPDTIDALVQQNYQFQVSDQDWSVLRENFLLSPDPIFATVLQRINDDKPFCQALQYANQRLIAVIDEEMPTEFNILNTCKNLDAQLRPKLRRTTETLFPSIFHSWVLRLNMPFVREFSRRISHMESAGIFRHWELSIRKYPIAKSNKGGLPKKNVSMKIIQIRKPLCILGIGLIAAFITFCGELWYFRRTSSILLSAKHLIFVRTNNYLQ